MAWLDAWAKLLLQQQHNLEQQLAKFTPVVPGEGLVCRTPQRSDWSRPGTPLNPTGGRVSGAVCREGECDMPVSECQTLHVLHAAVAGATTAGT